MLERGRMTCLFSCIKSVQIRTDPFDFGTTTMEAHHSLASLDSVDPPLIVVNLADGEVSVEPLDPSWPLFRFIKVQPLGRLNTRASHDSTAMPP